MKTTSIEARNEKIRSGTIDIDYAWIYNALRESRQPLTYTQIAKRLKWWNPNKVSRRTKEMVELGLIDECGTIICPLALTKCITYKARL